MYHFGEAKDRPEPDFRVARHSIDLLAMLQEKTRGNVTIEEQRLVENALTELRFRFVQAMESKKTVADEPEKSGEAEKWKSRPAARWSPFALRCSARVPAWVYR